MLVSSLSGSAESGQAFTIALYFNSTRWCVTIEVHVPAYQKKPKTEFRAIEARPASHTVLQWELTFTKTFLKSYGRLVNDWGRDNAQSLIERHRRWLNTPAPIVTDLMALATVNEAAATSKQR